MSTPRYTTVAILVHWATVALVGGLFALGWYMVELPKGPSRGYFFALHKSLGLTVFALLCVRVMWRLFHRPPPFPPSLPAWQAVLARAVHHGFYLLLVLQPASGYLSSSFSGHDTLWFGAPLPSWGWSDAPLNELFTEVHEICSVALLLLIAMHVIGVIRHLLAGEWIYLERMRPW